VILFLNFLEYEFFFDEVSELADRKSDLLHGVSVTNGDGTIFECVEVNCDAVGCADFILTAVSFTD